jgi:cobalamin biosynthesis protein CbiG
MVSFLRLKAFQVDLHELASFSMSAALVIGIGCRRGVSAEAIERAVRGALGTLAFADIVSVASIDAKKDEAGLLAFCERHQLRVDFFSADQIKRAPGEFLSQARRHLNVDGVCEPCALIASGGRLVVHKTIAGGVTVAIAETPSKKQA